MITSFKNQGHSPSGPSTLLECDEMIINQTAKLSNKNDSFIKIIDQQMNGYRHCEEDVNPTWQSSEITSSFLDGDARRLAMTKGPSTQGGNIATFDRVGLPVPCGLRLGNICILARPSPLSTTLNIEIIKHLIASGRPFEIIKASDFAKLSSAQKSNAEIQYFIQIDINDIPYEELLQVIEFCKTKFILQIPGLKLDHNVQIIDEQNLAFILHAFGGDRNLLKYLAASLSDEEFLLIEDNTRIICSLYDAIG